MQTNFKKFRHIYFIMFLIAGTVHVDKQNIDNQDTQLASTSSSTTPTLDDSVKGEQIT